MIVFDSIADCLDDMSNLDIDEKSFWEEELLSDILVTVPSKKSGPGNRPGQTTLTEPAEPVAHKPNKPPSTLHWCLWFSCNFWLGFCGAQHALIYGLRRWSYAKVPQKNYPQCLQNPTCTFSWGVNTSFETLGHLSTDNERYTSRGLAIITTETIGTTIQLWIFTATVWFHIHDGFVLIKLPSWENQLGVEEEQVT